uniref:Putative ELMO domain-containing protein A isoform X2 n=1 Tax=Davidia involucrata TaxID=16924 RepID=A0A5B7AJN7_DAVIN
MVGPRAWIAGIFSRSGNKRYGSDKFTDYPFSPLQERRLKRIQERLQVPFDETRPDHQEALGALWRAAFPDVALKGLISEQWKDMGWQGANPSTDFRLLFIGYCSSKVGSEQLGNIHLLLLVLMYHSC